MTVELVEVVQAPDQVGSRRPEGGFVGSRGYGRSTGRSRRGLFH